MVDVAGVVEGVDDPTGDEVIVEDEGRRPKCAFVAPLSPFLSETVADCRLDFRLRLWRKLGIAVMLS